MKNTIAAALIILGLLLMACAAGGIECGAEGRTYTVEIIKGIIGGVLAAVGFKLAPCDAGKTN